MQDYFSGKTCLCCCLSGFLCRLLRRICKIPLRDMLQCDLPERKLQSWGGTYWSAWRDFMKKTWFILNLRSFLPYRRGLHAKSCWGESLLNIICFLFPAFFSPSRSMCLCIIFSALFYSTWASILFYCAIFVCHDCYENCRNVLKSKCQISFRNCQIME